MRLLLFALCLLCGCTDPEDKEAPLVPELAKVPDSVVTAIANAADECTAVLTSHNPLDEIAEIIESNWAYITENAIASAVTLPTGERLIWQFTAIDEYGFKISTPDFTYEAYNSFFEKRAKLTGVFSLEKIIVTEMVDDIGFDYEALHSCSAGLVNFKANQEYDSKGLKSKTFAGQKSDNSYSVSFIREKILPRGSLESPEFGVKFSENGLYKPARNDDDLARRLLARIIHEI